MADLTGAYPVGIIENSGIRSSLQTSVFTGIAKNIQEWTESSVSGGGGGGSTAAGGVISIAPIQTTHHRWIKFWLHNPQTGEEMMAQLNADLFVVREGQTLSLIYSTMRKNIDHMRAVNHSMGLYYKLNKSAASYVYASLAGKIFFAALLIFLASFWVTFPLGFEGVVTTIICLPVITYIYMHFLRWEVNKQLDELASQILEKKEPKAKAYGASARMIYVIGIMGFILFLMTT